MSNAMATPPDSLLKLVHDSKALSIWNRKMGPVFWYVAGEPGPFYLNTELMIGRELAENLLETITKTVAELADPEARAARLKAAIIGAYARNADYRVIIQAMIEKAQAEFPAGAYAAVSGGERRDWLFSIPFAEETGVKHIYLFKNKSMYCGHSLRPGEKVLHISDLINNAASYFDLWLPMLKASGLACAGTLTVNTRGAAGIARLEEAGCKVAALNRIDLSFFRASCESGLIDADTLNEIAAYFSSAKEWAARYLMRDAALFDVANLDKKSFERMKSFFDRDPWGLREGHKAFFDAMRASIAARQAA
jgi:hypothetical protein